MGYFEQLAEIKHQEGIQEGLGKAVRSLLLNTEHSPKKIAGMLGVPISMVRKLKAELQKNNQTPT